MRRLPHFASVIALLASQPASAHDPAVGRYRITDRHDAAAELLLRADGSFAYALAEGALDEHAEGRWRRQGGAVLLTTRPKPVAPVFQLAPRSAAAPGAPTLRVTWPDGRGIGGVDFRIGFDQGAPLADYTQEDGWTLPPGETRIPRWIELVEPIYGIVSPRYPIAADSAGTLNFIIVPGDIGVVDFEDTVVDVTTGGLLIHRDGGDMRFVRESER